MSKKLNYIKLKLKDNKLFNSNKIIKEKLNRQKVEDIYNWDDINIFFFRGNYLLDLGDTILPKESIMIIRCFWGKLRIIVPIGVKLNIDYSSFYGTLNYDQKKISIKNERLQYNISDSQNYPQEIKIFVNSFVSTLEIISG